MNKFSVWSILTLVTVALAASTVFAVGSKKEERELLMRQRNPLIYKGTMYAFPDESQLNTTHRGREVRSSVSSSFQSASPGKIVGTTYYDYQANGSMKRQVVTGHHGTPDTMIVHFAWMKADDVGAGVGLGRGYGYRAWNAKSGSFTTATPVHIQDPPLDFRAGYVVQDVSPDGLAVVGGHQVVTGGSATQIFWDFSPGAAFFTTKVSNVPFAVSKTGTPTDSEFIWPAIAYQVVGSDTITHVVASSSEPGAGDPQALKYFRKDGRDNAGTWTLGKQIDTSFLLSYDIAASKTTQKVAIMWMANLPNTGDCDTCSSNSGLQFVQFDNDLYIQISTNGGTTWGARKNVTKGVDGVEGYRAYANGSVMINSANNVIATWGGRYWPADANTGGQAGLLRGRLFVWSEAFPANTIRTAHAFDWDQTDCNGGAFNLNVGKMNIAECDGKLYIVFTQYNDIPNGVGDDCAARAGSEPSGSANGELYVVISADNGVTWDQARDITNSRTPGCDSATGAGGPCYADVYPTLTVQGTNYVGSFGDAPTITPSGGGATSFSLDLQYIQDADPGGTIQNEGTWQNANVAWARLACVEPVPNPILSLAYTFIEFPAWCKPNVQKDTALKVENTGNVNLTYTVAKFETFGPAGWLTFSGFTSPIASGFSNTVTGSVHLNTGGISNPTSGKVVQKGGLVFTSNAPSSPDTLSILFTVADTVIPPSFDTLFVRRPSVAKLALTVSSNGNIGNQGIGGVNLDYDMYGDCDTANSDVYLYDGSTVIGWISGGDTIMNWSIFGQSWLADSSALRPYAGLPDTAKWLSRFRDCSGYEYYRSGRFVTFDTSIAMQKVWYAPKLQAPDDSMFVIQCLKVWSLTGAKTGLVVGEAIDWDIPSDSGAVNRSAVSLNQEIWQRGVDYADTSLIGCQADSLRYGGIRYLYYYKNNTKQDSAAYGAYTAENDSFVFPNNGFKDGELYKNMSIAGFAASDSIEDLHMVMTYKFNFSLAAMDTARFYTVLSTVRNGTAADLQKRFSKGKAWFNAKSVANIPFDTCVACCCVVRGNVNNVGGITVNDLTFLVAFLFNGGTAPPCIEQANVNGIGGITVTDLTYLVAFLFNGGAAPPQCIC